MHEAAAAEAGEVSGVGTGGGGSAGFESEEGWGARANGTHLEKDSDPGVAGSGLEPDPHGRRHGHLSARGATCWVALPGGWVAGRVERGPASQADEDARRQTAGSNRGNGVRATPGGMLAVDHRADRARSETARDCSEGRARNHPAAVCKGRAKAVAGKKCGVCPNWIRNMSSGWRRY